VSYQNSSFISELFSQKYPELVKKQIKINPSYKYEKLPSKDYINRSQFYTRYGLMEIILKYKNSRFNLKYKDLDENSREIFYYHLRGGNIWTNSLLEVVAFSNNIDDIVEKEGSVKYIDLSTDNVYSIVNSENFSKFLINHLGC
jgi:hypothetical protein